MERSSPTTLLSIQALRAAAAAWVVIYHLVNAEHVYGGGVTVLGGFAQFGFAGVDVFFVISGFIMATVTAGWFGSPGGALDFLGKRAIRIYPLYWLCTAAIIAVLVVRPAALDPAFGDKSIVRSLLLLPQEGGPLLAVGWTLTYELFFYAMTALALAFAAQRRIPYMLGLWALILGAVQAFPVQGPWGMLLASPLAFEFIAGAVVGLYWRQLPIKVAMALLIAGGVWLVGACAVLIDFPNHGQSAGIRTLAFGPPAALIIAGLARLELAGKLRVPRIAVALGDASYSLYLTHLFVLSICGRLFARWEVTGSASGNYAFLVGSFIASCAVGLAVHWAIERPLTKVGYEGWRKVNQKFAARSAVAANGAQS